MAILVGPMGSQVKDPGFFIAHQFKQFPGLLLTRHGWLIASYDTLRSFVTRMKVDPSARDEFNAELQSCKSRLQSLPGDEQPVLVRYGRRREDKVYDGQPQPFQDISTKTGSAKAPKIGNRLSSEDQLHAIQSQGKDHSKLRQQPLHSDLDQNMKARVTDIDPTGDYQAHWGTRQFEAHHIVEDSLVVMQDARKRFTGLNRGSSLCVLLCAELHQRFYTSALARTRYLTPAGNLSERDQLNTAKSRAAFEQTYNQLYADPEFADLKAFASAIIDSLFSAPSAHISA